jgi:hypothetical protein
MRKKTSRQLPLFEEEHAPAKRSTAVSTRVDTGGILKSSGFAWPQLDSVSGAWITDDGLHRLLLWRAWSSAPRALFAMLNPSSADAKEDDPTVRRCVGFAKGWGCGGVNVVNLYSLIETDSKQLWETEVALRLAPLSSLQPAASSHADVYGGAVERSLGPLVLAWGSILSKAQERADELLGVLLSLKRPGFCLGTTRHGHPRHPLFLPATTRLEPVLAKLTARSQPAPKASS